MPSQRQARSSAPPAVSPSSARAAPVDRTGGRGNAARAEALRGSRGPDQVALGIVPGKSRERLLAGDGDALFASAGDAVHTVPDDRSYTQALLRAQDEHPEWTLAETIRYVTAQNVNGNGSELAMTEEAAFELGCPAEGVQAGLVVGNATYSSLEPLPGAERDARAMASTYEGRGYDVDHRQDLSGAELGQALACAGETLGEGDEMLLYFAGHGDFDALLGVDASRVGEQGRTPHDELLGAASRLRSQGVKTQVVLDACRAGAAVDEAVAEDELGQAVEDAPSSGRTGESDLQPSSKG